MAYFTVNILSIIILTSRRMRSCFNLQLACLACFDALFLFSLSPSSDCQIFPRNMELIFTQGYFQFRKFVNYIFLFIREISAISWILMYIFKSNFDVIITIYKLLLIFDIQMFILGLDLYTLVALDLFMPP